MLKELLKFFGDGNIQIISSDYRDEEGIQLMLDFMHTAAYEMGRYTNTILPTVFIFLLMFEAAF